MITDEEARKLAEEVEVTSGIHPIPTIQLACKVIELLDRQRWIPVSERFPKIGEKVAVKTTKEVVWGAWTKELGDGSIHWCRPLENGWSWVEYLPICWLPLPQPPEQET